MRLEIGAYVKISRNAERFWVKVTSQTPETNTGQLWNGTVENNLHRNPYKVGDHITFAEDEVIEHWMEQRNGNA